MPRALRLALWLAVWLTVANARESFAQLQSLGAVKYFVIHAAAADDVELQTPLVEHLRASGFSVGERDADVDPAYVAVCDVRRDANRRTRVVLECRDAAGAHVGTLRGEPGALNRTVGAATANLVRQLNGLRGNFRPLTSFQYVFVEPMAPAAQADLEYFRETLRRHAPFEVTEDPSTLPADSRDKVLYVRLKTIGASGPLGTTVFTGLVLSDETGTLIDTVTSEADVTFKFGVRRQWLKRMDNAAKDLRRDWERDRAIYASRAAGLHEE
jgi:hypothetical protein